MKDEVARCQPPRHWDRIHAQVHCFNTPGPWGDSGRSRHQVIQPLCTPRVACHPLLQRHIHSATHGRLQCPVLRNVVLAVGDDLHHTVAVECPCVAEGGWQCIGGGHAGVGNAMRPAQACVLVHQRGWWQYPIVLVLVSHPDYLSNYHTEGKWTHSKTRPRTFTYSPYKKQNTHTFVGHSINKENVPAMSTCCGVPQSCVKVSAGTASAMGRNEKMPPPPLLISTTVSGALASVSRSSASPLVSCKKLRSPAHGQCSGCTSTPGMQVPQYTMNASTSTQAPQHTRTHNQCRRSPQPRGKASRSAQHAINATGPSVAPHYCPYPTRHRRLTAPHRLCRRSRHSVQQRPRPIRHHALCALCVIDGSSGVACVGFRNGGRGFSGVCGVWRG